MNSRLLSLALFAALLPAPATRAEDTRAAGQPAERSKPVQDVERPKVAVPAEANVEQARTTFKTTTKDGALIVEVSQPGATIQILNDEGKVEVRQPGDKGTVSICVDSGNHRLKVEKDGFAVFGQDLVIASGGKQTITAKLIPLTVKPMVARRDRDERARGKDQKSVSRQIPANARRHFCIDREAVTANPDKS